MKKYYLIILTALLFSACTTDVWLDHDDPRVYIPKYGFSINKAWILESQEYTIELSAYCSGLRPNNQNSEIVVNYTTDSKLITEYNNDVTNEYSGKITELPTDCYSFSSDKILIPKGKANGEVGIKVNLKRMKELGLNFNEVKYAIPLKLNSTSMYNLKDNESMLGAIYCITIDEPTFYFYDNRGEDTDMKIIAKKVLYGDDNDVSEYKVVSYGLKSGEEYTLNLEIDEGRVPTNGVLLPSNAYKIPSTIIIPKNSTETMLKVEIITNNVLFQKTYYLPISIKSTSKYVPHAKKSTLMVKVEIKNDYEWSYKSLLNVESEGTQRKAGYSVTKSPTSISDNTLRIQMVTNNTIAGATGTSISSTSFNNKYYRLKIIPTDNKNKWKVEIIKESTTPTSLEFNPDKESYFDWDYETFYLNYRFKDAQGKWVNVSEILEAQ